MARELVVAALLMALAGLPLWAAAAASPRTLAVVTEEREAWTRVFRPIVASLLVFTAVVSWAIVDPDSNESVGVTLVVVAMFAGLVVVRALIRLSRAVRQKGVVMAGTTGLLAPRVHVAPQLAEALDDGALKALLAHERAHARHRDPARQLLAQFATDLQWPIPGASERLARWRASLEIARDDEARAEGVDGADLAHAIVVCARMSVTTSSAVASAMGAGDFLALRVRRLLDAPAPTRSGPTKFGWLPIGLVLSVAAGALAGEHVIAVVLSALP